MCKCNCGNNDNKVVQKKKQKPKFDVKKEVKKLQDDIDFFYRRFNALEKHLGIYISRYPSNETVVQKCRKIRKHWYQFWRQKY